MAHARVRLTAAVAQRIAPAVLVLTACVAACAPRRTVTIVSMPASPDTGSCDSTAAIEWHDSTEAGRLAATRGRVYRRECRLVFRGPGGDTTVFVDDRHEGDRTRLYTYAGPAGEGLDLVKISYYEGGTYMLVGPSGDRVYVAGPPRFSPDSTRFASHSMDLEAGFDPNVLEIWRLDGHHPRLEIAIRSEEWGPSDVRWENASALSFVQNFPTESITTYRKVRAELTHGASGWALSFPQP